MPDTAYVIDGPDDWLDVKRESSGQTTGLPEYLQVEISVTKDSRDYFTVLEGVKKSKQFSVKAANLKKGIPGDRAPARLTFSISKNRLTLPDGEIKAITVARNPPPLGIIPIQIPDFPHIMGTSYQVDSIYRRPGFILVVDMRSPAMMERIVMRIPGWRAPAALPLTLRAGRGFIDI